MQPLIDTILWQSNKTFKTIEIIETFSFSSAVGYNSIINITTRTANSVSTTSSDIHQIIRYFKIIRYLNSSTASSTFLRYFGFFFCLYCKVRGERWGVVNSKGCRDQDLLLGWLDYSLGTQTITATVRAQYSSTFSLCSIS